MNIYFNPVKTYEGIGCVKMLDDIMFGNSFENVIVIAWDKSVFEMEDIKNIFKNSSRFNFKKIIFEKSNPDISDLYEIYNQVKNDDIDVIVAIGGGSVLDIGKSLCCIYKKEIGSIDELREIIKNKEFEQPYCKWIGIPTTAGTGSEVTCWATIWDTAKNSKLSIESFENYAAYAFVDPQFAETMPLQLAVSSALDAMAHAVESYWAKHSNAVSKANALYAIKTINNNIWKIIQNPKDMEAHDAIAQGSMIAGLAFSNTKTTACHSISYPLTLGYKIPHGIAVSMLIYPVMDINRKEIKNPEMLIDAFGVSNIDEIKENIQKILDSANIKSRLRDWGVKKEDIVNISKAASTKGRIDNNPVDMNENMIFEILEKIY